ncbi:MAG: hypothetical protein MR528_01820 [Lachnospiraceae bacterium]|nr:hypothetical protein [Lachnospiraceae bacterium]
MRNLKRMAVLSLIVLALGGCTKSSISTEAPVAAGEEFDPAKMNQEEEETLPREQNFLIEEETEPGPMYEWEQVQDELDGLFTDTDSYPQTVKMEFSADEDAMSINLTWILKNGTDEDTAMEYAADMVQKFNDIVAVQDTSIEASSEESFGSLWDTFALTVQVGTEDGQWLIDKNYEAGEAIDLKLPEYNDDGPQSVVEENIPKKN